MVFVRVQVSGEDRTQAETCEQTADVSGIVDSSSQAEEQIPARKTE